MLKIFEPVDIIDKLEDFGDFQARDKVNYSLLFPDLDVELLTNILLSEDKPINKVSAFQQQIS
jgi:hypothetical protein